jgi:signal transduction histidine kinase/CheY-like chemotaxis protein/ligand-binding sensor domain-containing protein
MSKANFEKGRLRIWLSIFSFILTIAAHSQTSAEKGFPFITNYTSKTFNALPQTWAVIEDKRGIMYFGAQNCILEYDGVAWRRVVFEGAPPPVVRALAADSSGRIYYGSVGDIGYLDTDQFGKTKAVSLLNLIPAQYRNFFDIWSIRVGHDGIYFQAREYIFRIDGKQQVKVFTPKALYSFGFYLDGEYYVHELGIGLQRLVNDQFELIPGSDLIKNERTRLMLPYGTSGGQKQYLIGTFYKGLYLYDGKTIVPFKSEADDIIKTAMLYGGILLPGGNFALATTGKGVLIMDKAGKLIQIINRDVGMQDESIYNMYYGKDGTLWMALDNGISKLETNSPFTRFTNQSGINTSTLNLARFEGKLYLGTNNGLLEFDDKKAMFNPNKVVQPNQIFYLLKSEGELLVPSDGLYAIRNGVTKKLVPSESNLIGIHKSVSHPDVLYAGTSLGVQVYYRGKNGAWEHLGHVPGPRDQFWTFTETSDGQLWAGTQNQVAYLIKPYFDNNGKPVLEKYSFKKYGAEHGLINGVGQVNEMFGDTWFVADTVFYRFDLKKERFYADSSLGVQRHGGGNSEGDIIKDHQGRYWVRWSKETMLVTKGPDGKLNIDRNPFLPINDLTFSKIVPDDNGIVWICTTDGLIRYDEKLKKDYSKAYKTILRQVRSGTVIMNPVSGGDKRTELAHNNNVLRFEYAAPFFDQEDKTKYQTWLEGFDEGWSELDKNYYKEYTNLSEGKYTFHVRAKNIYEQLSEEAVYTFYITPPWYRSWWAYLLYMLLVGGLIYAVVRNRTRQLKLKQKELELTVAKRTKELSHRVEELAVINSVQEGLVRELNIQAIYDLVGEKIREIFNAKVLDIAAYDDKTGLIHDKYSYEKGDRSLIDQRPVSGFRKYVVDSRQILHIKENADELSRQYNNVVVMGEPLKSAVFVPMIAGDKVTGVISLQDTDKENAFSDSDVSLLTTLANSMSVALQNAKLFEETKLLLAETEMGKKNVELLSDIGKKITSSLDFETIFYNLYEHINQLADASIFGIGIYNPDENLLEYKFAIEKGKRYEPYSRSTVDKNQFPVWCIDNRKPVFINDVTTESKTYIPSYVHQNLKLEDGTVAEAPASLIYLPLIAKDSVLGIISVQSFRKNAYTPYHLNLLQNLATYTSIALDNASAYRKLNESEHEIAQRMAEISTVNNISQALAAQIELEQLIQLVGEQMRQLFNANIVYLALLDKKSRMINFPYQFGDDMQPMKLGEGLTSKILLTGKPLLMNKEVGVTTEALGVSRVGLPAASYLGVPIPVGDEFIGVLSVQSTEKENRFDEKDQRLLTTIAANVGVAIKKAQLFEDVRHAQQEADAARKTAEQANDAKSAFLSTVSHELRTPLTSVLGFAKIIKKRLEEKVFPLTDKSDPKTAKTIEQVSENLNVVVSEGQRLTHLINDVLDLAKIEAGKMEWHMDKTSVTEVVERAIAATSALFDQKSLVLDLKVEDELPEITGDRDKLIQVVVNLLSNAVKFTDSGKVSCRIYHNAENGDVITSITDTGIGIAEKDHAAVFEQFKQVGDTLTDKPKGTGLGLPICKEIVEHHGGRIWLDSEIGKGSTFSFAIPVLNNEPVRPMHLNDLVRQLKEQMQQSELTIKAKHSTILVVDDDDSIRSLLRQELTEAGYYVKEATNGKEALDMIRDHRPDLVILDIMMPEMNGFDVAAILKNDPQTMEIPIIVLSIVQDKARGLRVGVDRYLTKPIDTSQLFSDVDSLLMQGKSRKKVMVVDEDNVTVRTLTDVLEAKGYQVVESDGKELVEKAIANKPDIIILNSLLSGKQQIVQSLRFEKGLENVLFLIYQ